MTAICRIARPDHTMLLNPERAAVADPEPKPPEADLRAVDGAGSSSEANARQTDGCGSIAPQCPVEASTGKPVSHGQAGGMPALTDAAAYRAGWRACQADPVSTKPPRAMDGAALTLAYVRGYEDCYLSPLGTACCPFEAGHYDCGKCGEPHVKSLGE